MTALADVAVIGAGPAGATVAARLAQLGHSVVVLDRARRRSHQYETLSPTTLELLELTGADQLVRDAGFAPVDSMTVEWDDSRCVRAMPPGSLLIDRDHFDALLVDQAVRCGATILRAVTATARRRVESGWEIAREGPPVRARFVVDATGRPSTLRRSRGDALLAVTGRWEAASRDQPAVVALDDGWVWAAPSAPTAGDGGRCDVTVFVDPAAWRTQSGGPVARYTRLVEAADVVANGARLVGGVSAADASGALAEVCGPDWLAVGDAALALDPLSSSGVQRAVQGGLTAAVVIHTALTYAADTVLALDHYRHMLTRASAHHVDWTQESYAAVAAVRPTAFWTARAKPIDQPIGPVTTGSSRIDLRALPPSALVRRSPSIRFVEVSQVVGNTVQLAPAVEHPGFDGAIAYVGGTAVVPLLAALDGIMSIAEVVETWATAMPAPAATELAGWLLQTGALEEVG